MPDSESNLSTDLPGANAILKIALGAAVLAALLIGVWILVLRFAASEEERDLRMWQTRLGIIADTRADAVESWLAMRFDELTQLAENASLQLYMTELVERSGAAGGVSERLAESGYLRNLLTLVASRGGYTAALSGLRVDANVRQLGAAGLALVDPAGRVLVATDGMPPVEGRLKDFVSGAPEGERALLDVHKGPTGLPTMAFSVPVFAVQEPGTREIGRIIGVRPVVPDLFDRLKQPGVFWETAEAVLVRHDDARIEYLSPTQQDHGALARSMAFDTPDLAARFALDNPGGFGLHHDYRNFSVLVTSRRISLAPWSLMYKIDRAEALGEGDARRSRLITLFCLIAGLAVLAILLAWRHGASQRAARSAALYQDLARKFDAQARLLRLVTDNQPSPMFIVDAAGTYHFANRAAAARVGMQDADMIGKSMVSVMGSAEAGRYEQLIRDAMTSGIAMSEVRRSGTNGDLRIVQAEHIPLHDAADLPPGVMVVEEDITTAFTERERRERTLGQLIETLLTLVDRRDPYAADHSTRVASVARAIAQEIGLDEAQVRTAETAGRLMNLGKILVPADVLSRAGELDDDEIQRVRESIELSADLVEGVEFDGPVVATLRQLNERWDGSGSPSGLKGEDILITARIVAVANAFVAMISPRAWRTAVTVDEATRMLTSAIGTGFERRVVTALLNLLDNRGAMAGWAAFSEPSPMH